MNANDPHQKVHDVTVNGTKRQMMMGDIYVRGGDDVKAPMDFEPFRIQIRDEICKLPFSAQPHWIKIVAAQVPGKPTIVSSTVDNRAHDELDAALKALKWPGPNRGYMMKEFIVLK